MRFYLGKFSNNYFNQLDNKFYECDNINKLNGLIVGDYVFIYPYPKGNSTETIRLWRVNELVKDKSRLEQQTNVVKVIFETVIEETFSNIDHLIAFKYFDLNTDIVVNSHMATKFAFLPLVLDTEFDSKNFFDINFYKQDNLRKVKITSASDLVKDRYHFQIYFDNESLKCIEPEFGKMPGEFKDNRIFKGRGSTKKDRAFDKFNKLLENGGEFSLVEFSIYSFYFCFFCDYAEKVNYWVFQGNPEIYDVINAIKDDKLKSWSVKSHKDKIKTGDKFILWLTGRNAGCYAIGEVVSEIYSSGQEADSAYYKNPQPDIESEKVEIIIEKSLINEPISASILKDIDIFKSFKGGNQGTNFIATKEQYEYIANIELKNNKKYWLYAPGENANMWDEFYSLGIMGLGFDQIGDLNEFKGKEDIQAKFQEIENTTGNKMNDTNANYQFKFEVSIGDIVIVKRGRSEYLGYGIVSSDYYYDTSRSIFKKCRKVNWKKRGNWTEENKDIVLKTLTDITKYPEYVSKLINLIGIEKENMDSKNEISFPLNQILYGAPGTGKTYKLRNEYFAKFSEVVKFDLRNYYSDIAGKYSNWEIIAIILLLKNHVKVNEIYSHNLFQEKAKLSTSNTLKQTIWFELQKKTKESCEFVNLTKRDNIQIFTKDESSVWSVDSDLVETILPDLYQEYLNLIDFKTKEKLVKRYVFTTFHQSMAYEDFIEGIKPKINNENNNQVEYEIKNGIFKDICNRAKNDPQNNYAIFIDEINRGNLSSIFGELITLIEDDKRENASSELKAMLPYSRELFSVPKNLYIIGTMNTADRSVEALDTALRRRFSFVEMQPNPAVLNDPIVEGIDLKLLLQTINSRIELIIDKNHQIGHAYFINIKSLEDLVHVFKNKIIPLLEEYFYGDYGKIGLVLGKAFIQEAQHSIGFADFDYEDAELLKEKKVWEFTNSKNWTTASFQSIYG